MNIRQERRGSGSIEAVYLAMGRAHHVFAGFLALCLSVVFALPVQADAGLAGRVERAIAEDPPHDPEHPASVIELSITSNGLRMPGHLYVASGPGPHPTFVLLHGFPGNERNLDLAQALRRFGFNVLYFHYRGAWGADGEYRVTQLAEDTAAALTYLRDPALPQDHRVDADSLSLLGHSLGGFTALAAGSKDEDLACVIALSPANVGLWKAAFARQANPIAERLGPYADSLFMLQGLSGDGLAEDLKAAPMESLDLRAFGQGLRGKALLMLVGEDDQVTPAATMFDPVVEAYRKFPDMQLTARPISGDHSFSWSRIELTREVLRFADTSCRD